MDEPWITRQGWRLILVHRESTQAMAALLEKSGLHGIDHLEDPTGKLYAAFGLDRGSVSQLMGPRVWGQGIRALLRGHWPGKLGADVRQMPGTFLVHRGEIVSASRARHSGDHPDVKRIAAEFQDRQRG